VYCLSAGINVPVICFPIKVFEMLGINLLSLVVHVLSTRGTVDNFM